MRDQAHRRRTWCAARSVHRERIVHPGPPPAGRTTPPCTS
ncbi:hypothetical protein Ae168Ps1_5423 [Pseudonocardia sp. Ae168_Ps1]|nr:hypothetical protein Ae168Ps1_5423 [Pseudonocardia sp. Ae168_Ps1]OLL77527.1 hypothetical protein Ae150APs1_5905c [Pseudonocardia sp. Ae150A_Ps1]OLL88359.1 hypothetical protein Ae263Ps1_5414 [Pseudonocardia sp. Ae263_Ps1]OLL91618.1 hypothetical protein Ae356Ps1_1515c [Pseudonocardia sp. Ae356_Ps1]